MCKWLPMFETTESRQQAQSKGGDGGLDWRWLGAKDHAEPAMHDYQVGTAAARFRFESW
jgi:hypothetical protein